MVTGRSGMGTRKHRAAQVHKAPVSASAKAAIDAFCRALEAAKSKRAFRNIIYRTIRELFAHESSRRRRRA